MTVILEACVTSPAEAVAAILGGAGRLELCRDLDVGGLTPDRFLLEETRSALEAAGHGKVPVFCMVRSGAGPFLADTGTLGRMVQDLRRLRDGGADGFVLGLLTREFHVDGPAVRTLKEAAGELPVTFHRAFDQIPDPHRGLEVLGEAGIARVLTGGARATAWEGRDSLAALVGAADQAPGLPRILGAGGIRADHVVALLRRTGLKEIHARAAAYPALARAVRDVHGRLSAFPSFPRLG